MFWCTIGGGGGGSWGMCGFWSTHHLNYACGGVGQNESGGVKQCTGHFYSFISFI